MVAGSAGYGNSVLAAEACDRMGVAGLMMALSRPGPDKGPAGYAADAVRVVRNSGLPNQTDAMFTTIEGE